MKKRAKDLKKGAADEMPFEEALSRLEKTVEKLEAGDLPLEESLKLYEDGVRLSRTCNERLGAAERRIEILERSRDGALRQTPFTFDSGEE
jgi:exodeoxyribonuclease VII small subunit